MSTDPRKIAAQVIGHILEHKSFSKQVLSKALDNMPGRDDSNRDKGFCTELVYGTLRWLPVLEDSIMRAMNKPNPKLALDLKCHLLVAAYQLQHLSETIPAYAAVSAGVNLIKKKRPGMAGFANAILRNLGSSPHLTLKPTDSPAKMAKALGLPVFLIEALPEENRLEAAIAMNDRPQTWYRTPEQGTHPFVPGAALAGAWVQDPASQVAGLLVNPPKGAYVIDACAAPGSKSRILKEAVGDTGQVLAVDQSESRLSLVDKNIETKAGDFRTIDLNPADAVLLDAPCSGYGTLRRHPEIKFWRTKENIQELATLQAELLEASASKVKPGGVLVYSVCSPLHSEGRDQISAFLAKHPEFTRDDPRKTLPWLPAHTVGKLGEITLWPHLDQADAFFAARLCKAL
ncbi:MAG: transcription antitermination factor NusB [Myxococcota bacterium]